ncbi:hypothetical protein ACI2KO_11725 [Pseudomonas piscis]|uniref:hypothetical protein n=1 Tax=Pseudomonas piscis TaxID=2614538 RepID=UPI00385141C3
MSFDIKKIEELEKWYALFKDPGFPTVTPEARYEARLALADDMRAREVIDTSEWRELVEEATFAYAGEISSGIPLVRMY